jgi:hypothetical protein
MKNSAGDKDRSVPADRAACNVGQVERNTNADVAYCAACHDGRLSISLGKKS